MIVIDTKNNPENQTVLIEEQERLTKIVTEKVREEMTRLRQLLSEVGSYPYTAKDLSNTIISLIEIMEDILFALDEQELMDRRHIDLVAKLCDVYKVDDRIRWSKE